MEHVEAEHGVRFETYHDLHRWSIADIGAFWSSLLIGGPRGFRSRSFTDMAASCSST